MCKEVLTEECYKPLIEGLKDAVIIDAGGYLGLASIYFCDYAKKIYVIEPSEANYELLVKNIKDNGLEDKIIPFKLALAGTNGKRTFYDLNRGPFLSVFEVTHGCQGFEVESITIEKFMEDNKIDYVDALKMDIEGSEFEVLESKEFRSVANKIGRIIIEAHPIPSNNRQRIMEVPTTLQRMGFDVEEAEHASSNGYVEYNSNGTSITSPMPLFLGIRKTDVEVISVKKPVCFFTIAYGDNYIKEYAQMMTNSLNKFHPDIPHVYFGDKEVQPLVRVDQNNKYRLYAMFGMQLAKEYELVINIDNDCIVTGDLNHIINDKSYDIGGVLNNNNVDPKLMVWDIEPAYYLNAGLVAIRGERPWNWWNKQNFSPGFTKYQFREQDILNIIAYYGDLTLKVFDYSDRWHGLVSKGSWDKFVLRDDKIIMPKTEGICGEDKEIKVIHWAGGPVPKMNYWVSFTKEVAERLDQLVHE